MCDSGRQITDLESGEIVCGICGRVSTDKATEGRREWRLVSSENNSRQRLGSPSSLAFHDMGLSTIIGRVNKDSAGRNLDASMNYTMQRLRTWDARTRAQAAGHRSLLQAFNELERLRDKLSLSDAMVQKTAYIYRKAQEKQLAHGRSVSSILAAAIYIACRELGSAKTLRDLIEITNVKRTMLTRSYRLLVLELDIKVPSIDPMKCIIKIANRAKLSEKIQRVAMSTMNDAINKEISAGKDPMGLAAAVLYLSCLTVGEATTQRETAVAAGVTEVTIRTRFKDLQAKHCLNALTMQDLV
ncbi:MAG: transcription initiation factor IIB [Thermoproteota archaeon]|nr:transcription initiation factor IIB [Thermoproteota archaeon]